VLDFYDKTVHLVEQVGIKCKTNMSCDVSEVAFGILGCDESIWFLRHMYPLLR
jgi:hypothetical protein